MRIMRERPHIVVIAGEASGDVLGGGLVRALLQKRPDLEFSGVCGPQMASAGVQSIFPMSDIAVMGLVDVLRQLPYLFGKRDDVVEHIVERQPNLVICIDAPDFNHRVAQKLRSRGSRIPIIDYVTPSVWFWRPGRAAKMAHYFDYGLCLLPFEPEVMAKLGGPPCAYVGHRATQKVASDDDVAAFTQRYEVTPDKKVVALIPGSRRSEIRDMLPMFLETARRLQQSGEKLDLFIPTVPHVRDHLIRQLGTNEVTLVDREDEKAALFRRADLALATSGTVALELGLAQTPMIIGYSSNGVFYEIIGKYLSRTPSVNLVNLVLDEPIIPELLYDRLTVDNLTRLASQYLSDEHLRAATQAALGRFCDIMRSAGPSPDHNAADLILNLGLLP